MARTSNIVARVEPKIKEQAEMVLDQLGISMSNAIGVFLRQIVLHQGIPFDVKLPVTAPIIIDTLNEKELNAEISKGFADAESGKAVPAEMVAERMRRDYGG